ncbi:MAG: SH3 domain-containing protein [Lachnospiraceae bacterium]|nr:SH3 domain-containing protein [Lachnospiraceae bacterium]
MRHSRRAVMTERYKLYMKKHIFNGRYFVRNMQLLFCTVVVTALIISCLVIGQPAEKNDVVTADASVSVKSALFGNVEEQSDTTREPVAENEEQQPEENTEDTIVTNNISTESIVAQVTAMVEDAEREEPKEEESEFAHKCIANVEGTLNIRKEPNTEAEFVGSMNQGAIAIVEGTEGDWTKIKSGDVEGYVLTEYVLTGESAEEFATDFVTLHGTVLEDGVNIRSEKSTDSTILVVLDKDDTVTVLNETEAEEAVAEAEETVEDSVVEATAEKKTDKQQEEKDTAEAGVQEEIEWLPVRLEDGQVGYVSSSFVEVDEFYEIAVSAEELQRIAEEEAARKAAEEEAKRVAEAAKQSSGGSTGGNTNSSNSNSDTYQGATTTPVTATESGECIGTFTITAYCGCDKCSSGSGKTASGTTPTEGRTIAADTSILPYGTQVVIDGIVYTVEDCGSGVKGNHIDIFFSTHKKAMAFGRKSIKVYKY